MPHRLITLAVHSTMGSSAPRVLISCAKGETHDHREGFRPLYKRLRAAGYAPSKLSAAASDSAAGSTDCGITAAGLAGAAVLVFGCPTQPFTAAELDVLRGFLTQVRLATETRVRHGCCRLTLEQQGRTEALCTWYRDLQSHVLAPIGQEPV